MSEVKTLPHDAQGASAKRWRNWWAIKESYGRWKAGDITADVNVYPCRDIAETRALEELADPIHAEFWDYLGAFPEGVEP